MVRLELISVKENRFGVYLSSWSSQIPLFSFAKDTETDFCMRDCMRGDGQSVDRLDRSLVWSIKRLRAVTPSTLSEVFVWHVSGQRCYVRVHGLRGSIPYLIGRFPCRSPLTLPLFSIILEGLTSLLSPDLLRLDLGGRFEERIAEFGNELANWVSEKEDDGREKCLMFHCFSNRRSLEQLPP
ncbi:hypothetical protein DY000_02020732 [Brassica cretica]|uniref:Uncharacterized protein n=1 Tax=Brassica cretica TaxID=69181 RepID=A0ABQ7ED85_BRACR|nr:hypothetical protein DY000_02020732 [Brassica cretica]